MEFPFDGIEAIYYQNTKKDTDFFISYAVHNDLLITCGSDFHGDHEGDERHGRVGCMSMPEEYLEKFLKNITVIKIILMIKIMVIWFNCQITIIFL